MFDNEEYDCRTPQDWLSLGYETEMTSRKPIPAKALLSVLEKTSSGNTHTKKGSQSFFEFLVCLSPSLFVETDPSDSPEQFIWHLVGVLDYRTDVGLYKVQRIQHKGKRRDKNGSAGHSKKQADGISTSWWQRLQSMSFSTDFSAV